MRRLVLLLFLLLCVGFGLAKHLHHDDVQDYEDYDSGPVKWPPMYYLEGVKNDMIQQSVVPFKLWYRKSKEQLRVECFNNTITTYSTGPHRKSTYSFHYEADEDGNPTQKKCYKVCKDVTKVTPLPDMSDFELTGEMMHQGKMMKVYYNTYDVDTTSTYSHLVEETMYLEQDQEQDIPVMYTLKRYNSGTGSLIKHVVYNYFDYTDEVNSEDFIFDDDDCIFIKRTCYKTFIDYDFNELAESKVAFTKHNEREMRQKIFEESSRLVNEHNSMNLGYKLTLNKFADRTWDELNLNEFMDEDDPKTKANSNSDEEFEEMDSFPFPYSEEEVEEKVKEIPEEFDWREFGVVSRVKSQGSCGSCWAFAATAAVEAALAIKHDKTRFDLSEQSVVDCAWAYEVHGCDGGQRQKALDYIQDFGIPTEEEYGGYLQMDGECHINDITNSFNISGYVSVPTNVNALKVAIHEFGPVAVSIYMTKLMHLYSNGVFHEIVDVGGTNHAVLVVGYGVQDGELYWIVKNSHGVDWGMDGYIFISARDNTANLLTKEPVYPLV